MGRATLIIVIGLTALLCIIGGYLCSKIACCLDNPGKSQRRQRILALLLQKPGDVGNRDSHDIVT